MQLLQYFLLFLAYILKNVGHNAEILVLTFSSWNLLLDGSIWLLGSAYTLCNNAISTENLPVQLIVYSPRKQDGLFRQLNKLSKQTGNSLMQLDIDWDKMRYKLKIGTNVRENALISLPKVSKNPSWATAVILKKPTPSWIFHFLPKSFNVMIWTMLGWI